MAANRFYTILIVPEKTSQVRRFVIPSWLFRSAAVGAAIISLTATVMVLDYWYVMSQVGENKTLRMENRRLRQQVQVFKNKMDTIESTMDRVKTFATRLKVITNIEDRNGLLQSLNQQKLPDASTNIGMSANNQDSSPTAPQTPPSTPAGAKPILTSATITIPSTKNSAPVPPFAPAASSSAPSSGASSSGTSSSNDTQNPLHQGTLLAQNEDPEELFLRRDYEQLEITFSTLNTDSLYVEQMLQDEYELLADQKSFLAALPTRKPAVGYFTSGFGVRKSPIGGSVKMHEGLDIANRPGTPIHAPADGTVLFAGGKSGYGQTVVLDHGYGLETWYGHTKKVLVKPGQKVRRGDVIALLGNTGRSTGPHVHYEVRVHGTPVDPLSYILEN
jgi:murein DD-endopeptidase MepM/ murein hydrolase activator NlpD